MIKSFYTVGIGASAGGLPALIHFFDQIPDNIQVAFVVVTHLIRDHRSSLKEILSKHTSLPLIRLESDMVLKVGKIYLIIENTTLTVKDGCFKVSARDKCTVNSCVNIFFESLAEDFREMSIGIILQAQEMMGWKVLEKLKKWVEQLWYKTLSQLKLQECHYQSSLATILWLYLIHLNWQKK